MAYWHLNRLTEHYLKDLSPKAGYIGLYLAGKMDKADRWQISRERIRKETGRNNQWLSKALTELEAAGVIVTHRASKRAATEYFYALSCPPECEEISHRSNGKRSESPVVQFTESPDTQATESPDTQATNRPSNRPIKKERDLQVGLSLLISQLTPLLEVENPKPVYVQISQAIEEQPEQVEELLNERMKRADYPAPYLDSVLATNPFCLVPKKARALKKAQLTSDVISKLEASIPEAGVEGLSEANKKFLGKRGYSSTRLRYAQKAEELGLELPEGLDTLEAGQLIERSMKEQQIQSEAWQGKRETSGAVAIS
jgi:hypothetical protein